MIKLLLRQILKHWKGLLPVAIVWTLGGWWILSHRNTLLTELSHFVVRLPEPGEQKPDEALVLVEKAREKVLKGHQGWWCRNMPSFLSSCDSLEDTGINLRLMRKACALYPYRITGDSEIYRPHWLDKIQDWNLSSSSGGESSGMNLVEPDEYWQENRPIVLSAVKDLIDAMNYAYEIPVALAEGKSGTLLIPQLVAEYASAICADEAGIFAWGDYVQFQEFRAYRRLRETNRNIDREYVYPAEQQLIVLEELKNSAAYAAALDNYKVGSPPEPGNFLLCRKGLKTLSCVAPYEAVKVYAKLIYISDDSRQSSLHLQLGNLHSLIASRRPSEEELERAVGSYRGALNTLDTEKKARLSISRIFIQSRDYPAAYAELSQIYRIQSSREEREFRELFRFALMGIGRHRDADCFTDLADMKYGGREHCRDFRP